MDIIIWLWAASGVRSGEWRRREWEERGGGGGGGSDGVGVVQPGDGEDRALQQMARDRRVPLRRPLPVRSWCRRAPAGHQTPTLQDTDVQDGTRR